MKSSLKYGGYLLSLVFLYLTFRGVDYTSLFLNFPHINVPLLVIALFVNLVFFSLRALYQESNLQFIKNDIPFTVSLISIAKAQCYNVFLPARIGELLRIIFLAEKTGLGKTKLLSYIVIEKFIDFTFFVILFFIISMIFADVVENMLLITVVAVIFGLFSLYFYIRYNGSIIRVIQYLTPGSLYPRIETLNREIMEGILLFRSVSQVIRSSIIFLAGWATIGIIFYLISWPFLGALKLPIYAPVVLMVFSALSLAIPSAPSAIGTMHFAFLIAIRLMTHGQYDLELAAGFIVILHFFVISFDFIIGGVILLTYNLRTAHSLQV